jgi:hypothetical protein
VPADCTSGICASGKCSSGCTPATCTNTCPIPTAMTRCCTTAGTCGCQYVGTLTCN